jgi:hypothetical protein
MITPTRSIRPKCPECGFSVFNRRFAKCESCGALLPTSIAYSADELKVIRENDRAEEARRLQSKAKVHTGADSYSIVDRIGDIDFSD